MGKPSPRKGKNHTKETKEKLSIIVNEKLKKNPNMFKEWSEEHEKSIEEEKLILELKDYKCTTMDHCRPDIIAMKDGKVFAVEVEFGKPDTNKYIGNNFYDDIIWLIKERKK